MLMSLHRFSTLIPSAVFLCSFLPPLPASAAAWGDWPTWGDQRDGTYRNPVLPGDYSDIDCIRVGDDFYAISSTFQYSPGMVILKSRDLVNWTIAGHAVTNLTEIGPELNWDRMDRAGRGIWAGSIRHHAGKFWVYFGTPEEGYFMTTAKDVSGPWEPLTQLKKSAGWDDCCPFWDDDGQGYFIGSQFSQDPANGKKYNIHLWKMTPDGKALIPESDTILHQSNGSEANKLFKHNGTYYHYYSEVKGEGRVPMMGRAKNILGPYEHRQICHVNNDLDKGPNQGGIVQVQDGSWWFFTHHGAGDWSGRCASLLPVNWIDGWPVIGTPGPDGIGNMVWSGRKPVQGIAPATPQTDDDFSGKSLPPQWEWHYHPRAEKWSLTDRPGFLRLHAFKPLRGDNLVKVGNILTQRSMRTSSNVVTTRLDLSGLADGQRAGLCHLGAGSQAAIGVIQQPGKRCVFFSTGGKLTPGAEFKDAAIWLRTSWGLDGMATFAFSNDGNSFQPIGESFRMTWAAYRGSRIGLFSYNPTKDAGFADFDSFHYTYSGQASPSKPHQETR